MQESPVFRGRKAGVLLHPTSLPGPADNGILDEQAYYFVDFLESGGQRVWQVLPLGPTHDDLSPYQALSVHAGNPRLINWSEAAAKGWLEADSNPLSLSPLALAEAALAGFRERASTDAHEAFARFCETERGWLDDFALYRILREQHGHVAWFDWPAPLRDRDAAALAGARSESAAEMDAVRLEQYLFRTQWLSLRRYANERGVLLFGDLPIFVAHDSADVWAQRDYFRLRGDGAPEVVAGVPPDYFSEKGQRWGNPHYDWGRMQEDGFQWWVARMETQLKLFDVVRIDHFRGFEAFWEIEAGEETAVNGRWCKAPGDALFNALHTEFGSLPIVAEDLGTITPEVHALREAHGLPGMRVLQFAFDGNPQNPYLPHNHERDSVVYTGTHDNDTTLGWYQSLDEQHRAGVDEYLGWSRDPMPWPLIRGAYASVAELAVIPLQDALELDASHRMNTPGTTAGNWSWRFQWDEVQPRVAERLRRLAVLYDRI